MTDQLTIDQIKRARAVLNEATVPVPFLVGFDENGEYLIAPSSLTEQGRKINADVLALFGIELKHNE